MTEYTITIEGYESGLTKTTVESIIRGLFPHSESISVDESEPADDSN
jgi:hypothetical protein